MCFGLDMKDRENDKEVISTICVHLTIQHQTSFS